MSLLEFQQEHYEIMKTALEKNNIAIDSSDTGTGKTYVAFALAKALELKPIIICPKSVIPSWMKVSKLFGIDVLGISNYELMRHGNWINNGIKQSCEYFNKDTFEWNPPEKCLFIFDEVHRCKNEKTVNSKILLSTKETKSKILLLSATVADKPKYFSVVGYMTNFCSSVRTFNIMLRSYKKVNPQIEDNIIILHSYIFPEYGSRIKMADLGKYLPKNIILPGSYSMNEEEVKDVENQYALIKTVSDERKEQHDETNSFLAKIIRARQRIEALKVSILIDQIDLHISDNLNVAVFVNFRDTLDLLSDHFKTTCLIMGGQSSSSRQKSIDDFQSGKSNIIICMIQCGGVGISLHDVSGERPRVSIISPPWSAQNLVQALGRIYRVECKSQCIQKIVYCSGTIEERICDILKTKIENYSKFNDGHK